MNKTPSSTRRLVLRFLLGLGFAMLVASILALLLIAIPITRRLIIVGLAEWMLGGRLESLAVDLDIQPNLRWIFVLLVILPVGFGLARMVIARSFSNAARGLALAAGALLALGVLVWWQTRHFNFDAQGRPVVYLSFRRDGGHKSYSPGIDRLTGRPKYEVTLDRVSWLSNLAQQPVREVDPAIETNWFDPNSGEANLWYVVTGTNQWQFFSRPLFHPQLQVEALPVTPELMKRWQAERDCRLAAAEAIKRQRQAEANAAAEKKAREQREEMERKRQADLRIREEAEALARLEMSRREQEEKIAQKQKKAEKTASPQPALEPSSETPSREILSQSAQKRASRTNPRNSRQVAISTPAPKPLAHQHCWIRRKIDEPAVKIVEMPFLVVGSIFKGLAGASRAPIVPAIPVQIVTPPPVSYVWQAPAPVNKYYPRGPIYTVPRPVHYTYVRVMPPPSPVGCRPTPFGTPIMNRYHY